jgi:hypothetical protein
MVAPNTSPLYGLTPVDYTAAAITGANTAVDGTGTVSTVFTAGANGAYVKRIRCKANGSVGPSVMRIFINNGSTNATPGNNSLWGELPLAATTASNSAAIGPDFEYPMNKVLQASYVINVCYGTAGGYLATVEAMSY